MNEAFDLVSFMPYPGREDEHSDVTPDDIARHMGYIDEKRREKQDLRLLMHSVYMLWGLELNMRNGGSGAYGVIDKDGYHYTFYDGTRLVKSFDGNQPDAPLVPVAHVGVLEGLLEAEAEGIDRILGIGMTYDGHLVAAAWGRSSSSTASCSCAITCSSPVSMSRTRSPSMRAGSTWLPHNTCAASPGQARSCRWTRRTGPGSAPTT